MDQAFFHSVRYDVAIHEEPLSHITNSVDLFHEDEKEEKIFSHLRQRTLDYGFIQLFTQNLRKSSSLFTTRRIRNQEGGGETLSTKVNIS